MDKGDERRIPRVLTVAGSDPSGGAGIQADIKTFTALQVYGMSVITSLTVQNSVGVFGVHDLPPDFVAQELDAVVSDVGVDAMKSGMLSHSGIIEVVADRIQKYKISRYVLDPVMRSKTGATLLQPEAQKMLTRLLFPLALVVTPNLFEASALAGIPIRNLKEAREACRKIADFGSRYVLFKGGHLPEPENTVIDVLYDGRNFLEFPAERVRTSHTHGLGCTLSAALAAQLAKNQGMEEAMETAKIYVTHALKGAFPTGKGVGSLLHFWNVHSVDTWAGRRTEQ
ncbi:MAG: bifunctional hydroxymethylpyrimidine kinase/phosphomethylpyrimidine kinase [bacterium JZ-2024 1]